MKTTLQPLKGALCRVSPETLDKLIERYGDNGYTNQYGEELIVDLIHITDDKEIFDEFLELTGLTDDQVGNDGYITFYH